jgi:hypothetical protein
VSAFIPLSLSLFPTTVSILHALWSSPPPLTLLSDWKLQFQQIKKSYLFVDEQSL